MTPNFEKTSEKKSGIASTTKALVAAPTKPAAVGGRAVPPAGTAQKKEVYFELDARGAGEVLLAGDFTGWEKTPIKLNKGDKGTWKAAVALAPGLYHYRFVVDGQWRDDPKARARCPNPYGECDSIVEYQ